MSLCRLKSLFDARPSNVAASKQEMSKTSRIEPIDGLTILLFPNPTLKRFEMFHPSQTPYFACVSVCRCVEGQKPRRSRRSFAGCTLAAEGWRCV